LSCAVAGNRMLTVSANKSVYVLGMILFPLVLGSLVD
jgi:hypothetical protein